MNFFEQQEQARRQTRTLVILFILAVLAIVIAVNVILALLWNLTQEIGREAIHTYPTGFFATNTLVTLAIITVGTLIEMYNLRDGGDAVAKMAGGRLVAAASYDAQERRLLNVVEEMAIASGIACPRVYVLDKEEAINAFAAGYNQNEAVVAVTRGTLSRLTRDELQGVIAHEFSHILNGDMRLNIRMIGLLFGIQMIAGFGRHLLDLGLHVPLSRRRSERNANGLSIQLFVLGVGFALIVIGYIGVIFGRIIKSAISRQREFLADASAVQFTRSADGIGGALRKIGGLSRTNGLGSHIHHPNAEQLSHLFLATPKQTFLNNLFATHPPLKERLRRIFGRSIDMLDAPKMPGEYVQATERLPDISYSPGIAHGFSDNASEVEQPSSVITFGNGAGQKIALPEELATAMREPHAACAVVYALLLGEGEELQTQHRILQADMPQQAAFIIFLAKVIGKLPKSARLPLLDLTMPALKQLSASSRETLLRTVDKLIAADNKIVLAEFVLQTVLTRRLGLHAGRATPIKYQQLSALQDECVILLSLVAHFVPQITHENPANAFMRGATNYPRLALSADDLVKISALNFPRVKTALDHANQLAPLNKPILIKMLLAAANPDEQVMPLIIADLLRAICAAIDAPVPPAVAATYTAYHW